MSCRYSSTILISGAGEARARFAALPSRMWLRSTIPKPVTSKIAEMNARIKVNAQI
jgi:hypothetical protein